MHVYFHLNVLNEQICFFFLFLRVFQLRVHKIEVKKIYKKCCRLAIFGVPSLICTGNLSLSVCLSVSLSMCVCETFLRLGISWSFPTSM